MIVARRPKEVLAEETTMAPWMTTLIGLAAMIMTVLVYLALGFGTQAAGNGLL